MNYENYENDADEEMTFHETCQHRGGGTTWDTWDTSQPNFGK